jgi:NPCBM-associated, NEW3 domain of alpha-galactosidase
MRTGSLPSLAPLARRSLALPGAFIAAVAFSVPAQAATGPVHATTGPARATTGPARATTGPARATTGPARAATGSARAATGSAPAAPARTAQAGTSRADGGDYQPPPSLPVNSCHDSTLPRSYGTNFPVPQDPNGYGFANQSVIGWEGNFYAPIAYLSGAYFARGVPAHYQPGSTTYCGGMYRFDVYNYGLASGQAPLPGSVQWHMADGYLPALTTSFTRNDVAISITDFADRQTVNGAPTELVYTRVRVTNHGSTSVTVPAGQSGPNLVSLNQAADTVAPGASVDHDFVAAVDTFGLSPLPSEADVASSADSYDRAFAHMAGYWNSRLSVIPRLSLPNVSLPDTDNLSHPGDALDNAYKAAFVYTRIVEVGKSPFSGANNYDWLLDHDLPGILANRFALGDFTDAQNLLLAGRISEDPQFNEVGANWYWDGPWRTPLAWAGYLEATNDTAFVSKYFHDDATGPSPWGPSLYTLMHTDFLSQLNTATGYLKRSFDNDSGGTWLFDDETALAGLSAYRYIATRIGDTGEAQWAAGAYTSLLNATNAGLAANEQANGFSFLPCEVNRPVTADRCNTANDANWASQALWGENPWDIFLAGGQLNGILGDPSQVDNLYQMGFARLQGTDPFPSFGAYSGYSVALNTGYSAAALFGNQYRDLPITSYAWQLATTTGGPNAWWEANGSPPDPNNPWAGSHAAPQFGAIPYVWPMAGQTQTLLQSLAAQGLVPANDGSYHTALYLGRGVPDAWLTPGQRISVSNLTASYDESSGHRATYGVQIDTSGQPGNRTVHVSLTGRVPTQDVQVQFPVLASAGVEAVHGGSFDPASHSVTFAPGSTDVTINLGPAGRPDLAVTADSTAPGQHTLPLLTAGTPATVSATVTGTGQATVTDVKLALNTPAGWTVSATSPASFATLKPGQQATASWSVTPPSNANGGAGLVVSGSYTAPAGASGTISAEQWTRVQPPLPLPAGASDLATSAAPSASYTSPWEHVTAINDGIYPTSSNDSQDLRWGCWPEQGEQWIELDWNQPVTTSGSSVYFLDDGGGVRLPASWRVQYWNGSAFVDVTNPSAYQAADNTFNAVTFDPVTTTRLRVVLESGQGSVGVIQWVVPSIPGSGAANPATKRGSQ